MTLKVFTCTSFIGKGGALASPVAAVIIAEGENRAKQLLRMKLSEIGLGKANELERFELVELRPQYESCVILADGEY